MGDAVSSFYASEAATGAGEALADLLDAIYAAATDLSRWEEVAARTTRWFGGPCSIYLRPDAAPDATRLLASALDPDFRRSHDDYYARKNIWIIRDRGGESAIRNGDDVVEGEDLERSEYFGDWLEPQGLRHGVTCGVRATRRGNLNYAVLRGGRRGPFGAGDHAMLGRLLPHVQRAFAIGERLEMSELGAGATTASVERLGVGVGVVDAEARMLFQNAALERLLAQGAGLVMTAGRLRAARPGDTEPLRAAIARATGGGRQLSGRDGSVLALQRAERAPLSVSVSPLSMADRMALSFGFGAGPLALVTVSDPEQRLAVDLQGLQALYGLTAAEARLVAALCAGRTLAEFAGAGGVSLTTARTHLVAAFAKTGENRQADLIRRVLGDFALVAAQPPSDGDASQRDV